MKNTLSIFSFLFIFILFNDFTLAQELSKDDIAFQKALTGYVQEESADFGKEFLKKERFIIEQMRHINTEIKARITNYDDVREKYFDGLHQRLSEISDLKGRLKESGSSRLLRFANELEDRIKQTIKEGNIDFKKQRIFEDALQLLYLAEEMLNLDTGASIEEEPRISEGMLESHQKFVEAFGEKKKTVITIPAAENPTIFDIFIRWRRTNIIEYNRRWNDILTVKNKLLDNGAEVERERMFKRELKSAITAYNYQDYDFADRAFEEILKRYNYLDVLDDIYFYLAEANYYLSRYNIAKNHYQNLVDRYPGSGFRNSALYKLTRIAVHHNDTKNVRKYYQEFEQNTVVNNPLTDNLRFIVALYEFNIDVYEQCVEILLKINTTSKNYIDAQYLLAQAYIGAQKIEEAEQTLINLINNYSLQPNFRNNVILKLGYINFEQKKYPQAIHYFDQIPGDFPLIDRVLIGYGWAYYQIELEKEKERRDFSYAKGYLNILVNDYLTSDYYLEANTLLGYIYQLEIKPENATHQFDYVYKARFTKQYSDSMIIERDSLRNAVNRYDILAKEALARNDKEEYLKAENEKYRLLTSYLRLSYSDMSSSGVAAQNEIRRINSQLSELDRLKAIAVKKGDDSILEKIENLQSKLEGVIKEFPFELTYSELGQNYFDEYPIARKESFIEDQNYKILLIRKNIQQEQEYIEGKLIDLEAEIARARVTKDYKTLISLEIQQDKYKELKKRYDFVNTFAYDLEMKTPNINVNKWSDYGAFGIANVNFAVKLDKEEKISYYSEQIHRINQILNNRKTILEHKIKTLEGEINVMTRNVRRQERLREREELNRKFQETYFDTHTTEFEKSTTEPPRYEDENIP
jgi:TolA-binding protein